MFPYYLNYMIKKTPYWLRKTDFFSDDLAVSFTLVTFLSTSREIVNTWCRNISPKS